MKKFYSQISRFISFFFNILPWCFDSFFAHILSFLWFDFFRIRRKLILENISRSLPNLSDKEKIKIARKSMFYLCRNIFDVLRIPSLDRKWMNENIVYEGLENLTTSNGILFLSLHLGSGDLGAAVFSETYKPLSLISKRFKSLFLDTFWFTLREQSKTQFIDAHGKSNAFEILKALKKGRGVVFVIDQFMGKPFGVETTFFGTRTGSAYGLALFAQKTKAPVLPLYTYWDQNGKLHIVIGKQIRFEHLLSTDLEKNNVILTQLFNDKLEQFILSHPEQWMWVHRRWKVFE